MEKEKEFPSKSSKDYNELYVDAVNENPSLWLSQSEQGSDERWFSRSSSTDNPNLVVQQAILLYYTEI